MTSNPRCVAVVPAGGGSRRWGGGDKTAAPLAGVPLLAHAVRSVLPLAEAVCVVAPADHPARPLIEADAAAAGRALLWTREHPPGGGPLAGLAAGLRALPPGERPAPAPAAAAAPAPAPAPAPAAAPAPAPAPADDATRVVLVVAGDLPFAGPAAARLVAALAADPQAGAAVGVDPSGRRQPLLAAYDERATRAALDGVDVADRPLRVLLDALRVLEVPVDDMESLDLDTRDLAARAERLLGGET